MTGRSGARTRLAGLVLTVIALTGCRVDTAVRVDVADDGSGTVTVEVALDQEAAGRIPDLAEQVRVRDLRRTGWEVVGPDPVDDGGVVITATKDFFEPEQLAVVLGEIGGRRGPILEPTLERGRSFATTTYAFSGTLDLSQGMATFSDPQLTELLDGFPIGQDQAALEAELGAPLSDLTSFTFTVALPDGSDTETFTWTAALGDEPVAMAANTEDRNRVAFGLAAGAVLAVVLLVLVLVGRLVGRVRRRRSRRG